MITLRDYVHRKPTLFIHNNNAPIGVAASDALLFTMCIVAHHCKIRTHFAHMFNACIHGSKHMQLHNSGLVSIRIAYELQQPTHPSSLAHAFFYSHLIIYVMRARTTKIPYFFSILHLLVNNLLFEAFSIIIQFKNLRLNSWNSGITQFFAICALFVTHFVFYEKVNGFVVPDRLSSKRRIQWFNIWSDGFSFDRAKFFRISSITYCLAYHNRILFIVYYPFVSLTVFVSLARVRIIV